MNKRVLLASASLVTLLWSLPAAGDHEPGPGLRSGSTAVYGNVSAAPGIPMDNGVDSSEVVDTLTFRDNLINPSFNGATGVSHVIQNNGNANTLGAASSVQGELGASLNAVASGAMSATFSFFNNATHINE